MSRESWQTLRTPALFAVAFGLILNVLGVKLPGLVMEPLEIMGQIVVPLAMLILGYMMAGLKFQASLVNRHVLAVAAIKLFVYPVLVFGAVKVLHLDPLVGSAAILQAAMPSMLSTPVFVHRFGGDRDLAVTAVFLTTLLSVVTIPLVYLTLVRLVMRG